MGKTRPLDRHVKTLRQKLNKKNSNVIIETVYKTGHKLKIK